MQMSSKTCLRQIVPGRGKSKDEGSGRKCLETTRGQYGYDVSSSGEFGRNR